MDVAVLAKELVLSESFEEFVLSNGRCEAGHIDKVLLNYPNANKILSVLFLCFAFLYLFLALFLYALLLVLADVGVEFGEPVHFCQRVAF